MIVLDMIMGAFPCFAATTSPGLDVEVELALEPLQMRNDRMSLAVDEPWPEPRDFVDRWPIEPKIPRRQSTE